MGNEELYEAEIKLASGNQVRVTITARSYFEAKDQIIARYCGGENFTGEGHSGILQGPWLRH